VLALAVSPKNIAPRMGVGFCAMRKSNAPLSPTLMKAKQLQGPFLELAFIFETMQR
jgi:hypothetical protein